MPSRVQGGNLRSELKTIYLMYDGTLLDRFVSIFKYVESWQGVFRRYDIDRSGESCRRCCLDV